MLSYVRQGTGHHPFCWGMKWDVITWFAGYKRLLNIGFMNTDTYSSYSLTIRTDFLPNNNGSDNREKKFCNEVSYKRVCFISSFLLKESCTWQTYIQILFRKKWLLLSTGLNLQFSMLLRYLCILHNRNTDRVVVAEGKKNQVNNSSSKVQEILRETAEWGCGLAVICSNQGLSIDKSLFIFSQLYRTE